MASNAPNHLDYQKLRLAMALPGRNRHYRLRDIERRHFNETAHGCGYRADMEAIIENTLARLPASPPSSTASARACRATFRATSSIRLRMEYGGRQDAFSQEAPELSLSLLRPSKQWNALTAALREKRPLA